MESVFPHLGTCFIHFQSAGDRVISFAHAHFCLGCHVPRHISQTESQRDIFDLPPGEIGRSTGEVNNRSTASVKNEENPPEISTIGSYEYTPISLTNDLKM